MNREERIPVGVLGATGAVGQRFVSLLRGHPWFEVVYLGASERSAGKTYGEAVRWIQDDPLPPEVAEMVVGRCQPPGEEIPLFFSALDSSVAGPIETRFAEAGRLVVSNAKNHRMDPGVPLLVPEVNPDHLDLLAHQDFPRGGGIITNPNCSTIGLVLALKPLHDHFGLETVHVVTLQALSGAGVPGVASMEIADNVIPFISGEEDKLETEPLKILGALEDGDIRRADLRIGAHCTRVPVTDGHTEAVSVTLRNRTTADRIVAAWNEWTSEPQRLGLPTAPEHPVRYLAGSADPQPRLHRNLGRGMTVTVGRLRKDPVFDWSFFGLSHNTVRGAAGGALLCAELAVARGALEGVQPPEEAAALGAS